MNDLFNDFIQIAEESIEKKGVWREQPVDLITFFESPKFMDEKPFEGPQTELLEMVDEIVRYKLEGDKRLCREDLRNITELAVLFGKGCLHGDSRIINPVTGEVKTMRELAEGGGELEVKSLNEETQEFTNSTSTGVVKAGRGSMYEVTTNSGRKIKAYEGHIFLSRNHTGSDKRGRYKHTKWVKLSDMKEGDHIAISNGEVTDKGIKIDRDELRLIGYLIGNGNISDDWKCTFLTPFKEVEEDYCRILRNLDIEPKYPKYSNEGRLDRNCVPIDSSLTPWESRRMGGNPVTKITRKYGLQGPTPYYKHIPKEFFDLDKESIIHFIEALYATDGWVCMINNKIPQIGYSSTSIELIEGLQFLLSKIGLYSRIDSKKTKSNFGISYTLSINSEVDFLKFCSMVKIVGKSEKQKEICDFIRDSRDINRSATGKKLDKDIFFERVKSIKYLGEDDYYDLTVEEYANYIADGFINHNSGKDFLASGILTYLCYILCCMNDPQEYFGFGQDEPIDLINVAINAYQANNVFFKKFKARLNNCEWFKKVSHNPADHPNGMYNQFQTTKNQVRFFRNIAAHSAHSEADSFEGFNPLVVIFDEIGGYEYENAENAYNTLRSSALSRYNKKILLIFISFPRSDEDFMMKKYRESEHDPEVYGIRGASWEVNPTIKRESLQKDYERDPEGAQMRFECIPPKYQQGLFQFPEKIDNVIEVGKFSQCPALMIEEKIETRTLANGYQRHFTGLELHNLDLDPSFSYYIGGDGGINTDSYVICLMHGEPNLIQVAENGETVEKWINKPVEDLLLEWRPSKKDRLPVDLLNVADILEQICSQVFVKKALFDKFNSADVVQRLIQSGVDADDKNFSNPFQMQIYQNLKSLIYTNNISLLDHTMDEDRKKLNANEELKHIQLINGNKIDHPLNGAKDFSDARASAAWICTMDEVDAEENFAIPLIKGARRRF